MSRFLTTEEIEANISSRKYRASQWEAKEQDLERRRQADLEARRRAESLYTPHLDAIEPVLKELWDLFTKARSIDHPRVDRTETGFELFGKIASESDAPTQELLTVFVLKSEGLSVQTTIPYERFVRTIPRDFAEALAKDTGRFVELWDISNKIIHIEEST